MKTALHKFEVKSVSQDKKEAALKEELGRVADIAENSRVEADNLRELIALKDDQMAEQNEAEVDLKDTRNELKESRLRMKKKEAEAKEMAKLLKIFSTDNERMELELDK